MLQVPANQIGFTVFSIAKLQIFQEVITLTVFVPFAFLYLKGPLKLDYLWAALCIVGAVYFIFRSRWVGADRVPGVRCACRRDSAYGKRLYH